jgi:hypothetical protein
MQLFRAGGVLLNHGWCAHSRSDAIIRGGSAATNAVNEVPSPNDARREVNQAKSGVWLSHS